MGKRLLQQRKGRACSMLGKSLRTHKLAPSSYPVNSHAQRQGYQVLKVRDLVHESGRSAAMVRVQYQHQTHAGRKTSHFVAVEGMYTGQKICAGKKAKLEVGNILYVRDIPESTAISNIELAAGDGGKMVRAAGTFATVFSHSPDTRTTTIKLPSGAKKQISNECRAMIGQICAAGITEAPLMKAVNSYYKRKVRGKKSVRVTGMNMNPVDHPHGGGNHKHIGKPTCVSRQLSAGKKAQGHIAARQTGKRR